MGRRTTFAGYIRQRGNSDNPNSPGNPNQAGPSPSVTMNTLIVQFSASAASSTRAQTVGVGSGGTTNSNLAVLPKGAVVVGAYTINAGGTGGVNPTYDMGLEGVATDSIVNEGDADTQSRAQVNNGTGLGVALTTDRYVTGGAGASAAAGGTVTAAILFYMTDDASLAN